MAAATTRGMEPTDARGAEECSKNHQGRNQLLAFSREIPAQGSLWGFKSEDLGWVSLCAVNSLAS